MDCVAVRSNTENVRKPGQGGDVDNAPRDLRAELLHAEAVHFAKLRGETIPSPDDSVPASLADTGKRQLENGDANDEEDLDAKRRRILEETRDIAADSDDPEEDDDSDSDRCVWNQMAGVGNTKCR